MLQEDGLADQISLIVYVCLSSCACATQCVSIVLVGCLMFVECLVTGEFPMFCFECLLLLLFDYDGGLLTVEFVCKDSYVFSCAVCPIMDDSDMNLAEEVEDDSCRDITQLMAENNPCKYDD